MPLAGPHVAPQFFLVDIVKGQPMLYALGSGIRGRQSFRMVGFAPDLPRLRSNLQWAELVVGNRGAIGGGLVYKPANQFFLDANFGSLHSFHVFVRRSLTFFSCRIPRSVSMLIFGMIFSARRYSRSFSSDHRLYGQPKRSGGHFAVSAINALSSSVNSFGRPGRGFGSRALRPRSLKSLIMART